MPIAQFKLPDGRIAEFKVPEGTTPEQANQYAQDFFAREVPEERDSAFYESFKEALGPQHTEAIGGIASMARGALGQGELTDEYLTKARQDAILGAAKMREGNTPSEERIDSLQKAWGGIGTDDNIAERFGEWSARGIGQTLGSAASGIAGRVAGAAVGSAMAGPAGAAIGATTGGFGSSYLLNAGLLQNDLLELGVDEQTAAKWSAPTGIGIAYLDALSPASAVGNVMNAERRQAIREVAKSLAAKAKEGAITEGITETAQEALQAGAETGAAGKDFFTEENAMRFLEAGAQGALGGGVLGAGSEAIGQVNAARKQRGNEAKAPDIDIQEPPAGGDSGASFEPADVDSSPPPPMEDLFSGYEGMAVDIPNTGVREIVSVDAENAVLADPETGQQITMPTQEFYPIVFPETETAAPIQKPETVPVYTPAGTKIDTRPIVVEADELITSHDAAGNENPDYPSIMQPRDRTRKSSQAQIQDIASNLNPALLGVTSTATDGAPIVGDGIVESGNGRVLGIKTAYERFPESAKRYRDYLAEQGYNIEGMKNPVLVRERVTPLDESGRADFAAEANVSSVASMSATEKAMSDARSLNQEILGLYKGGDIDTTQNSDFVRGFIQSLPQSERNALIASDGRISAEGVRRIQNAMLAKAYDDSNLIEKLAESSDNNIKSIGTALKENAGKWGMMRDAVASGEISSDMDITPSLIEAIRVVEKSRAEGESIKSLINQVDMFTGKPSVSPEAAGVLRSMFRDDDFKRPVSAANLSETLNGYVSEALRSRNATGDLLSGAPKPELKAPEKPADENAAVVSGESLGVRPPATTERAPWIDAGGVKSVGKMSGNYAKILEGWMKLLGMQKHGILIVDTTTVNSYLRALKSNPEKATALEKAYGLPARVFQGFSQTNPNEMGYYVPEMNVMVIKSGLSEERTIETIAHELGHAYERYYFGIQSPEIKQAVVDAYKSYASKAPASNISVLREMKWPKASSEAITPAIFDKPFASLKQATQKYELRFDEWFADQTARYFNSQKRPLGVVEKFFYDLAQNLKNFYAKVSGAGTYLPDKSIKQLFDGVIKSVERSAKVDKQKAERDLLTDSQNAEVNYKKDLDEDIDASDFLDDRTSRLLSESNYEKADVPRVVPQAKINKILKQWEDGKITESQMVSSLKYLADSLSDVSARKRINKMLSERTRGYDMALEKLIRARRTGALSEDTASIGIWLLNKNPSIANDLSISIRDKKDNRGFDNAAAYYNDVAKIITLFKNSNTQRGVVVHEILHHTERMMPNEIRDGIYRAWKSAFDREYKKASSTERVFLDDLKNASSGNKTAYERVMFYFSRGKLDYDKHYQLLNPSEYWAVNGERILTGRYDSVGWVAKAKQWLYGLMQSLRSIVGLPSDAPVIKAINSILRSDGSVQNPKMLSQSTMAYAIEKTSAGEQAVIPGAEQITGRELAERKMQGAMQAKKPQKGMDVGLFADDAKQVEMLFNDKPGTLAEESREEVVRGQKEANKGLSEKQKMENDRKAVRQEIKNLRKYPAYANLLKPIQNAKMNRLFASVYAVVKNRNADAAQFSRVDAEAMGPMYALPYESRKRVGDYMYNAIGRLDIARKERDGVYGNLAPEEIEVVKSLRKWFDKVPARIKAAVAMNAGVSNAFKKSEAQIRKELEAMKEGTESVAERTKINKALEVMDEFKTVVNYYPDIRVGDIWINVKNADGQTVFNDTVISNDLVGQIKGVFSMTPGRNVEDAMLYVKKQYPASKGFKITTGNVNMQKNPVSVGLDIRTINRLFEKALEIGSEKKAEDVTVEAFNTIIDELKQYNKPAFMKYRKGIARLPDIPHGDILMNYANIISHLPARMAYESKFQDAVGDVMRRAEPAEQQYANEWLRSMEMENNAVITNIRAWTFYSAFAFKIATPLANYAGLYGVGAPELGKYTSFSNASGKIFGNTKKILSGIDYDREEGLVFKPEKMKSLIDKKAYEAMLGSPDLLAYNRLDFTDSEQMKTLRGQVIQGSYEKYTRVVRVTSSLMGASEQSARAQLWLSAYESFKDSKKARSKFLEINGKNPLYIELSSLRGGYGSVESMSDWVVQETFFDAGKMNHAVWERGVASVAAQFKGYVYQLASKIIGGLAKGGMPEKVAALQMLGMILLLSGVKGLPFADDIEKLWKTIDDTVDFKTAWRRLLQEDLGASPYMTDAIINGAFAQSGVNIGTQFSMANMLPSTGSFLDAIPAASLSIGRVIAAKNREKSGQPLGAKAEMLGAVPGVGGALKDAAFGAFVYPEEGVRSQRGEMIIPPEKVTTGMRVSKALRTQPFEIEKAYQKSQAIKTAGKKNKSAQTEFHADYADLWAKATRAQKRGDSKSAAEYKKQMREMMEELRKKPKDEQFTPNMQAIKRRYNQLMSPDDAAVKKLPKQNREQGQNIQELYDEE